MVALSFLKYFWGAIWLYEEKDIFDYIYRIIASIFFIIPAILIFIIDILFSPIEIIASIIWKYKQKRR